MMEIPFALLEALFAATWLLCRMAVWIRRGEVDWSREAVLLLMAVNLAVILRFTLFPMARAGGRVQPLVFEASTILPFRVNLIPYVNLLNYDSRRDLLLNVIGNVAMFIPSGVVLPVVYKCLNRFWKVVAAGAALSLCIEIIQLPFSLRTSDIDDLLLNTIGVALGYSVYALVKMRKRGSAA